ncbi:YggS family pyridoxal phosphate-dependent enzyme [Pseudarthrobacter sp. BIM B-2242]|jgi:pyridoxal phosphate enzyme (YggS family)|uniref:YggS family pyridoxal phosphate-dependent enzyme n=1 Tax=Pseudarthrobacter sp. BIM B-2242 TaxID=2772401 RepID=UPI00168AA1CB|nr:YggS family pyridoxal phosphate-dependent enzyme [Pseudarthrobacter sp. BIM B-2242]QOD04850.1 YggS family pyridoxal phosphate-dependent enzyme [Pseudarthrobacter sp. BIM B-2242]
MTERLLDPADRMSELAERLAAVQRRIDAAAAAAGRAGGPPTLIVVTKFHPAADIARLAALGVRDVGENRDQEASAKAAELADLGLNWHFVGQLQSKKAKSVAKYAHALHSVDRPGLVDGLQRAVAAEQDRTGREALRCFIQVSLDADAGAHRGGAAPDDVPHLADLLASAGALELAGVMAVAPLGGSPEAAFEKLAAISASLVARHPGATAISAGMSQDLEAAIRFGATHLRIGSDILGSRPAVG